MGVLLYYSLITGCALLPLYLLYKLWLSKLTFYAFNRGAVVSIYIISLAFPLLLVGLERMRSITAASGSVTLDADMSGLNAVPVLGGAGAGPVEWAVGLYLVGLLFFAVRELAAWHRMLSVINQGTEAGTVDGYKIIVHDNNELAPFSWYRYIVLSRRDYDANEECIIRHEYMHLYLRHWIDLVLAEAVAVFTWYNPVGWLMRREIQTVHEYQADDAVLRSGINAREYQLLLIKKTVGVRFPSIANSLDHSNISKRIKMMLRKKSTPMQRWRAIAAVPALAVTALLLGAPAVSNALTKVSDAKITVFSENVQTASPVSAVNAPSEQPSSPAAADDKTKGAVTAAEKMPQYIGGNDAAMMNFLAENLRYPESAIKDSIQGRVVVRFIVAKTGDVSDVEILRKVDPAIDQEAERVVKLLKFTPGEVGGKPVDCFYTLPVTFRLKK